MRNQITRIIILLMVIVFYSCSSIKVLSAWKADQVRLNNFKEQSILVITRTPDNSTRITIEEGIVKQMTMRGYNVTESYREFPQINVNSKVTNALMQDIKNTIMNKGYTGVVVTSVKDLKRSYHTLKDDAHYNDFDDYYRSPYANESHYRDVKGYMPVSQTTLSTKYVVETVAYNLSKEGDEQLVGVVTSSVIDPEKVLNFAEKYVVKITKALDK